MKNRKKQDLWNWISYYSMNDEDDKIIELRWKYNIFLEKLYAPNEDTNKVIFEIKKIVSKFFETMDSESKRNIISYSSFSDKRIWNWNDSLVYNLEKNNSYVCKEAINWDYNSMLYLKNKYLFLKKYLWDIIPKSYFTYWEWYSKIDLKDFKKFDLNIKNIVFTLQKKVQWKNLRNMSLKEKSNQEFLQELEKSHKKYILLKFFLESKLKLIWYTKKTFDVRLDLGYLSNKDSLQAENIDFINKKLNSPNIMWDWEKIYFIDFGSWTWNDEKQKIFDYMMDDNTFSDWKNILKSYGLD